MAVLTFRGTELRDTSIRSCWGSIVAGWRDGVEVRGEDTVIPGKAGQTSRTRVDHVRIIQLHILVFGEDEDDWDDVCAELEAILDPALAPGTLEANGPYKGLSPGSTRSIQARTVNYRTVERVANLVSEYDVTLHAIGDPPDWSEMGS
jgi:hypothetical protein